MRVTSPDRTMPVGDEVITRKAASELLNDEWINEAFSLWIRWKNLGDPFGTGWALWPAHIMDIIDTIEMEVKKIDNRRTGS